MVFTGESGTCGLVFLLFFFNDTATTEIYTLSLHDALPICAVAGREGQAGQRRQRQRALRRRQGHLVDAGGRERRDRKSTRLNSSHANISYAVFCLKKKQINTLPSIL